MPEGPEVEIVRTQILSKIKIGSRLISITKSKKILRKNVQSSVIKSLKNARLLRIDRKGKYLFFIFDNFIILNHLGMTGHWRVENKSKQANCSFQNHDHYFLNFENKTLIYNDVRRFGMMEVIRKKDLEKIKMDLGWDPISDDLSVKLNDKMKVSNLNIKSILMNQKYFSGVGNIYASEVLFLSKLRPDTQAFKLTQDQWDNLRKNSKKILLQAIKKGGSTIQSYKNVNGQSGKFQSLHLVYGKNQKPCKICGTTIEKVTQLQRSTYFCPKCQK